MKEKAKDGIGSKRDSVTVVIGFVDGTLIVLDLRWSDFAKDERLSSDRR